MPEISSKGKFDSWLGLGSKLKESRPDLTLRHKPVLIDKPGMTKINNCNLTAGFLQVILQADSTNSFFGHLHYLPVTC